MIKEKLLASKIAKRLESTLVGQDVVIDKATSLNKVASGAVFFATKYSDEVLSQINNYVNCLAIVSQEFAGKIKISHIVSENPRLSFALILADYFDHRPERKISNSAIIHPSAKIGNNVFVGENVIIEEGVVIGNNTAVSHNVVILRNAQIGNDCVIKPGTIIGQKGFGFEKSLEGIPTVMPQIGSVVIGNNVEIGSCCTVQRGTLDDTVIKDNVKTDDHVHISHNVTVGQNTLIAAFVQISGSVDIGENVWISPGVCIINKIKIGNNAFVGIGSSVTKSVHSGVTVIGNPAKQLFKS